MLYFYLAIAVLVYSFPAVVVGKLVRRSAYVRLQAYSSDRNFLAIMGGAFFPFLLLGLFYNRVGDWTIESANAAARQARRHERRMVKARREEELALVKARTAEANERAVLAMEKAAGLKESPRIDF